MARSKRNPPTPAPRRSARRPLAVVVLAAGQGKRFRSPVPKVLHPLLERPMLGWVLAAAAPLKASETVVVVGTGADAVKGAVQDAGWEVRFALQREPLGTAHAVKAGLSALKDFEGDVLVLCGDTPLLEPAGLQELLAAHRRAEAAATVLTACVDDPTGYGRIIRHPTGEVTRIVEERDATEAERRIGEVNAGMYVFDAATLRAALRKVRRNNDQHEEYLTDVIAILAKDARAVGAVIGDSDALRGVNDRWQLAEAETVLAARINRAHALSGVTIVDPASVRIGPDVRIAADAVIGPDVSISGKSRVGAGSQIQRAVLVDATVGADCQVGPFAYLRPGARLEDGSKVGTYVEVKGSTIGRGSKVPHLSYVGDADIGRDVNVGAATVTVNYDSESKKKARTVIRDGAKIGSDTMLVAPVTVGKNAVTGAGSVVTRDVPANTVVVGNPARPLRKSTLSAKKKGARGT